MPPPNSIPICKAPWSFPGLGAKQWDSRMAASEVETKRPSWSRTQSPSVRARSATQDSHWPSSCSSSSVFPPFFPHIHHSTPNTFLPPGICTVSSACMRMNVFTCISVCIDVCKHITCEHVTQACVHICMCVIVCICSAYVCPKDQQLVQADRIQS